MVRAQHRWKHKVWRYWCNVRTLVAEIPLSVSKTRTVQNDGTILWMHTHIVTVTRIQWGEYEWIMDALLIGFKWSFNGIKAVWSYNVLIFFCPCSNLQCWRFIFHSMCSMKLAGSKASGSWWLVSHSYGCSCALRMWVPGNCLGRAKLAWGISVASFSHWHTGMFSARQSCCSCKPGNTCPASSWTRGPVLASLSLKWALWRYFTAAVLFCWSLFFLLMNFIHFGTSSTSPTVILILNIQLI